MVTDECNIDASRLGDVAHRHSVEAASRKQPLRRIEKGSWVGLPTLFFFIARAAGCRNCLFSLVAPCLQRDRRLTHLQRPLNNCQRSLRTMPVLSHDNAGGSSRPQEQTLQVANRSHVPLPLDEPECLEAIHDFVSRLNFGRCANARQVIARNASGSGETSHARSDRTLALSAKYFAGHLEPQGASA